MQTTCYLIKLLYEVERLNLEWLHGMVVYYTLIGM